MGDEYLGLQRTYVDTSRNEQFGDPKVVTEANFQACATGDISQMRRERVIYIPCMPISIQSWQLCDPVATTKTVRR